MALATTTLNATTTLYTTRPMLQKRDIPVPAYLAIYPALAVSAGCSC